ncbi:MAG: hypothetical protein HQM09_11780 [Candidatus Riflebacteria bacterium]|nr:hypothetical protein [Candidatus Riflebacteria bacterium]
MPMIRLQTTAALNDEKKTVLLGTLSKIISEATGKPETYVMVVIEQAAIMMSGKTGDAAFADIRGIGGLGGRVNGIISEKVCTALKSSLGISPDRIYLNFTNVSASDWGWNGKTFG